MGQPAEELAGRKPRRGDELEVVVERLGRRGEGVGTSGPYSVSLRAATPGSRVVGDVSRRRGSRIEARVARVLDPGPFAVPARCDHFGTCGGCAFQTLAYPRQLEELRRILVETLDETGARGDVEVEPVVACEDPWHYRNKMDFTFGNRRWIEPGEPDDADAGFALGLHVPGRWEKVLDVSSCAIHFAEADGILATVRDLARARGLSPWDVKRHEGLLRHLVLRKGFRTGEILVDIVTSADAPGEVVPFVADVLARHPEITTVVQDVNTRPASIAVGERQHVLHGPGVIHEEVLGLRFEISAGSFFQTNTLQAEKLFEIVRAEAACGPEDVVYDIYCGAGAIGLALAACAGEVWGFESVASAVDDARRNAERNGVANARFLLGDALAEVEAFESGARPRPDVCVVDPPRAGLHPKVVPALARLAPKRIVYVSCNPTAAARDLPSLAAAGFRVARIRPVDLFPHTPHLECVFTLEGAP